MRRRALKNLAESVTELDFRIFTILEEKDKAERELDKHRTAVDKVERDLQEQCRKLRRANDAAKGVITRMDNMLQAAKEELDTVRNIVIPGLVSANKTLTDARDAQSAVFAMQAAASIAPVGDQEVL